MALDPKVWGPFYWFVLHTIALTYPLNPNETTQLQQVRFRTLGCYPITAAVESNAQTLAQIVEEVFAVKLSERATRLMDGADEESMEKKKTEGYF